MAVHLHRRARAPPACTVGAPEYPWNTALELMSNPFSMLVSSRSWDWLRELCRPLGVQAQLLDSAHTPLLPPEAPVPAASLLALASGGDPALRAATACAFETRQPQTVVVNDMDVVCAPLVYEGRVKGVLVIARPRELGSGPFKAVSGEQLSTVGGWLAGAVERHLSNGPSGTSNLSALHKVLQHVQHGTDRDLVNVFAEALALWHDVDVAGYIETAPGVFIRAASLPGRAAPERPIVFPPDAVPPALTLTRMTAADVDGLDRPGHGDLLVTSLSRGDGHGAWLLTLSGTTAGCDADVAATYVSALDMAIALAAAASRTRVAMLLSHRLAVLPSDPGGPFDTALDALRAAMSASTAGFSIESAGSRVVYQAGAGDAFPPVAPADAPRMIVKRQLPGGREATLALVRTDGRHFTPLEHSMALVAAEILSDWSVRPGLAEPTEATPVFGRTMERLASDALSRGLAVTAVVVSTNGAGHSAAQTFVDQLKRQMRQSDAVGLLRPGEVGLLLPDTTSSHAAAVARRLRAALGTIAAAKSSIDAIGFATRIPGEGRADGILNDARANALHRGPVRPRIAAS